MSSVREFYKDKSIFVTGVSGFMGKVLLEKLLYSCSDLKQVFVLMREKRGKTGVERIKDFTKIPLFERLNSEKPEMFAKITPIYGDICLNDLGMSNDDLTQVINETNIVFHMAASVNFEEPVKNALAQNVRAVKAVIEIAKQMPNLVSMVHLSTAFCNTDQKVMDEVVYDWDMDPEKLLECADVMSDEILENVRKVLLKSQPNVYTYTKRLAEILVRNEHKHLPICIVRPSIGKLETHRRRLIEVVIKNEFFFQKIIFSTLALPSSASIVSRTSNRLVIASSSRLNVLELNYKSIFFCHFAGWVGEWRQRI